MALVWFDSCNNYGTGSTFVSALGGSYEDCYFAIDSAGSGKNVLRFPPSYGGGGDTCFFSHSLGTGDSDLLAIPPKYPVFGVGLDIYLHNLPTFTSYGIYPILVGGSAIDHPICFHLRINCTGYLVLRVYSADAGYTEYTSSAPIIYAKNWHHLEIEFQNKHVSDGTGYVKVYVENVLIFNVTMNHMDTPPTWPYTPIWVYPTYFTIINDPASTSSSIYFDVKNIFTWDDSIGIGPTTKLGNVSIADLRTTSDVSLNWTPSTGSDGYSILDNNPPSTSTYITASNTSVAAYEGALGDLPTDADSIKGVKVQAYTKALASADANIQLGLKRSGSSGLGTNDVVGTTAEFHEARIDIDPSTSTTWTKTGLDAATVLIDRSN